MQNKVSIKKAAIKLLLNYGEFAVIKIHAGLNSFKMSVKEWTARTGAIGIWLFRYPSMNNNPISLASTIWFGASSLFIFFYMMTLKKPLLFSYSKRGEENGPKTIKHNQRKDTHLFYINSHFFRNVKKIH